MTAAFRPQALHSQDRFIAIALAAASLAAMLRSKSVDLSKHVGHKVSVTGTMNPESEAGVRAEASEKNEAKGAKEAGDINISNLKVVSESCRP